MYAIMQYRKDNVDKPNEEREHLKTQYRMTRNLAIELRNRLVSYATVNNCYDEYCHAVAGFTYREYINALEQSLNDNLSEEKYEFLNDKRLTSPNIQSATKSLEEQFNALLLINNYYKLKG